MLWYDMGSCAESRWANKSELQLQGRAHVGHSNVTGRRQGGQVGMWVRMCIEGVLELRSMQRWPSLSSLDL